MYFKLAALLVLVSCASHKTLENPIVTSDFSTVSSGPLDSGMPNYVIDETFTKTQVNRAPASFKKSIEEESDDGDLSLKQIYFSVLYEQYLSLNQSLNHSSKVNTCPRFHNQHLEMNEKNQDSSKFYLTQAPKKDELAYYPVWSLPLGVGSREVMAYELRLRKNPRDIILSAVDHHVEKIEKELIKICDTGVSDNYFKLENIVTYFSSKEGFSHLDKLKAYLKVPVFSNMLLKGNFLLSKEEESLTKSEKQLMNRSNSWLINEYLVSLSKKRKIIYRVGRVD